MTKVGDIFEDTLLEEKLRVTSVTEEEINLESVPGTQEPVKIVMLPDHLKKVIEKGYWKLNTPVAAKKKRKRRKKKKVEV